MRITNIKCREDGEKIKLTWSWPPEIELVYVNGKLFTLQEYKKRGGCFLGKIPGITTYQICPFKRENGEDILYEQSEITVSFKTTINCAVKTGAFGSRYKNHVITLTSEHDVPTDIICYEKGDITYFFGEPLKAETPIIRIVRTEKNEHIRLFIREEFTELYDLC
ncbi:MAG: hypothetical protein FWE27_08345 [Defluviitaleaceae bacterium]|nr:hypothetical protein [Defluviitaleaceae bacterium]